MMGSRRSASVGALPHEKKHFVSRTESASGTPLDVRCACQFFESDSLLPERINPVDSRPGSKLGFHSDLAAADDLEQFHPMNLNVPHHHHDDVSAHSFEVINHADIDRFSQHSAQHGAAAAPVDLSFVGKYPELEHTARSRGLVVRSISDATEGSDPPGSQQFLAGHRKRQLSVGGLSTGSGRGGAAAGYQRDIETLSMRSGNSLRRIASSHSKMDLFVADINIPNARDKREQRSASMSRRTSNADLFQASIHHTTSGVLTPPQLNIIAATPAVPTAADAMRPEFTPRSASPAPGAQDYRKAKPPVSIDYMRPNDDKENLAQSGAVLPQNRPIDVSKYGGDTVRPSFMYETDFKNVLDPAVQQTTTTKTGTQQTLDPLQQKVSVLEEIAATHNLVDIRDNIQTETKRPPSLAGDLGDATLNLAELTKINIVSSVPIVDIDALIQSEAEKAAEANNKPKRPTRAKSPPPRRPKSPPITATLQLPLSRPSSPTQASNETTQSQLKRQHTPERQLTPERPMKYVTMEQNPTAQQPSNIAGVITMQHASPEVKSSYTSRFKSMFSKVPEPTVPTPRQKSPSPLPILQKSPSPMREKSPTPRREKSPSPAPAKLLSIFSKNKSMPMEIVSGASAVVTTKPELEPLSVKVTETFSLKVDDMDQYCTRPTKPLSPPAYAQTMYSSREDFAASERVSVSASVDISEAFAPVVVASVPRGGFFAGNRNLYTSEIETPHSRGSDTDFLRRSTSKEPSIGIGGSRPLISVPINVGGSSSHIPLHRVPTSLIGSREVSRSRAPSEQRYGLQSKTSFREPRTLSHDRASRITGSQENIYAASARMTKTVSFNFDERKSRLTDFESKSPLTQKQVEHRDFLERTYFTRDHEYEPIGVQPGATTSLSKESSPAPAQTQNGASKDINIPHALEAPHVESLTEYDTQTSKVYSSTLEELPQSETRKKGFMASAQDRTRRMQDELRNQAGKIRTKLRSQPKKSPAGSPKAKERRRFKAPEFSKFKMPEMKKPDMSRFKDMKRPEFTKFSKPDMSKFKLPEKFSTIKLGRSKSFKEPEVTGAEEDVSPVTPESPTSAEASKAPQKKMFEFNFGTYPRAFRKKKKPVEPVESSLGTEGPSIIPSTETQPSMESSSSPKGDRGPGPVRSRWADKFSDASYNDSEGSRYRRYGSELESFDRESSLERRMKDDLETEDTGSEVHEVGILGGVADSKQFAEFDEENRAIHEISNLRSREFKRRPIQHQDSDLRSEDSKDAEGWTEKEIQKNKLLRKAEIEAEASYYKYHTNEAMPHADAQSTASSGKKVVMEEIDDDEFFLRKRGISEDNIQLRQYISAAIREGYDMPNALVNVGQASEERMEYGDDYDVPPPKPRRLHKTYRPEYDDSQEFQRSDYGDDFSMSQNGSDFQVSGMPKRPMRKGRSRSKYSVDSQDIPMADEGSAVQYFDDDEEYLRPPNRGKENVELNNLNFAAGKDGYGQNPFEGDDEVDEEVPPPQPPRRRQKKRERNDASVEKDAFINGFGGRSVSNTFLQPQEDVIVYRTEHEYHIPLATPENYTDGASASSRKSRSASRFDEDDRTSRGADSLAPDTQQQKPEVYEREIVEDVQEEKFIIDMMENDGYAVVRKENMPKPTPPARRKKFTRAPGERFATLPSTRTKRGTPPPERPPPPKSYMPSTDADFSLPPRRRSIQSLDAKPNYVEDDYEEPEALERPESPRDLQSGEVINKMKFRPLPPPPRPPREKRQTKGERRTDDELSAYRYEDSERFATSSTADSYDQNPEFEVEVSTQTDPLPDDFVCEEFEITEDMKVIEPRRTAGGKTLEDLLREAHEADEVDSAPQMTEDEQLARGIQRFRDANQRSLSERSRASSQADRSKSLSRPQTPSAVVIERRVSTSAPTAEDEATVAAALIVRPISQADLEDEELRREEEELRREGLLSDSSVQSKSDVETAGEEEEIMEEGHIVLSDYAPSSADLDAAVEKLQQVQLDSDYESKLYDEEVERTLRDSAYEEEDAAEKYSDHYDEEAEELKTAVAATPVEKETTEEEDDWRKITEKELEEALEKELQEEMEKTLREHTPASAEQFELRSLAETVTSPEIFSEEEPEYTSSTAAEESELEPEEQIERFKLESIAASPLPTEEESELEAEEHTEKLEIGSTAASPLPTEEESELEIVERKEHIESTAAASPRTATPTHIPIEEPIIEPTETIAEKQQHIEAVTAYITDEEIAETPQPPPRRKSTTIVETAPAQTLTIVEQTPNEVAHVESVVTQTVAAAPPQQQQEVQLPSRLGDLEVERLRVHALQAGQIMVSQLHGQQISTDELACKSANLVVQNIELPPGFIEDIVERVRSSEPRVSLLTTETQTSRQPSSEPLETDEIASSEIEKPQKPPRQSKMTETATTTTTAAPPPAPAPVATQHSNLDEQTQTDAAMLPLPPPPAGYPSVEYLQSLAPLAFYNLQRSAEAEQHEVERKAPHKCRRRHVQRRRSHRDEAEEAELEDADYEVERAASGSDAEGEQLVERPISRRSRTRSGTRPPSSLAHPDDPKTVVEAGRQFVSACSLELVSIINQLTHYVSGNTALDQAQSAELQQRNVPALMVLFILITFGLLVYLLTGRNVHTHHWDYFNPPGNEGRHT